MCNLMLPMMVPPSMVMPVMAMPLPPRPSPPPTKLLTGLPTSPWAIILIHRADLPVSVEQRLFR